MENILIVGSGPAAYAAAMTVLKHRPMLFEGEIVGDIGPGGQLTTTTDVDNYPGFPQGIQGPELMKQMKEHAVRNGVRIVSKTVTRVYKENGVFVVHTDESRYSARCVIVATGASAKRLRVPGTGDGEFWQKGISACAVCDGFFFSGMDVAVIGGGDSAMEEAMYMSNIARRVYLVHRRFGFRARKDKLDKVMGLKNVEKMMPYVLVSAHGDEFLKYIKLRNPESGEEVDLNVDGLFFAIGHVPNTKFLEENVELDDAGYIITNERMHTSVEGLFACGDVQDPVYRQAVTAASSGYIAGIESCKYIERQ